MLTDEQLTTYRIRGIVRVDGFVDPAAAIAVADRVWSILGRRGIDRSDPTTWPEGFQSKLQALREAEVYTPFLTDRLAAIGDQILGRDRWHPSGHPQALITFPTPGPWVLPHKIWHFDLPARGSHDPPGALRLLGLVERVEQHGGATLVIEGSHQLTRRLVDAAPERRFGRSADVRKRLRRDHGWFRALFSPGGDRDRFFEPVDIDGVEVRVRELTGEGGDVFVMDQWMLHGLSPNTGDAVRSMWNLSLLHREQELYRG